MKPAAGTDTTNMDLASPIHDEKKPGCRFEKSNRMDNSLVLLTQKFAQMITHSFDGVLDLNLVSSELNVRKRRLYDITNVLEGIQLIRKTHKNHFQWLGGSLDNRVAGELKDLIAEEEKLDELIQSSVLEISRLWEEKLNQRYAYVTYEDVRGVLSLDEQAVMVIKAPPGTKLQVPHPEESLQMHLSSVSGPIEVFLCADTPLPMESTDAAAAGGAGSGQSALTARGKDAFTPLPPLFSTQRSSKEDAHGSCETRGVSNPESEVTPHSTPLTFIFLTKSCKI
ncbi:transcription factor E2F3 [Fundulus heteroclitus]|uniref:transcription factor E2F3 n=1 Tax=Fundulus heteroclitus TaxID=8078 RepID=UPI00165CCB7D|nr:transcription factor E2F3 [Fundulus heteroclitus]